MKVVLELHQQSSNIRRVTVRHDIVIGRGSDCNLRISVQEVSRRHCFLRIDSNREVNITDLESSNGTWLNGQRTVPGKRYSVEDGMMLAIGPVQFMAHIVIRCSLARLLSEAMKGQEYVIGVQPQIES